jgi:hypothetical protein
VPGIEPGPPAPSHIPTLNMFLCHDMPEGCGKGDDLQILRAPATILIVEVEVEVNLRPTVSRPVHLGVRRPSGTFDQFFFHLEIPFRRLRVCYFVAPSLTRGRVCNLL